MLAAALMSCVSGCAASVQYNPDIGAITKNLYKETAQFLLGIKEGGGSPAEDYPKHVGAFYAKAEVEIAQMRIYADVLGDAATTKNVATLADEIQRLREHDKAAGIGLEYIEKDFLDGTGPLYIDFRCILVRGESAQAARSSQSGQSGSSSNSASEGN
jgi:hypothetical protein